MWPFTHKSEVSVNTVGQQARRASRRRFNAVAAASKAGSGKNIWNGVRSNYDEDAFNKEYLHSLADVQGRAQDLDVNNPDIGGFHRFRTAQIIGAGVIFKHTPRAAEVGLSPDATKKISKKVDRARELHSLLGGFDSTDRGRSEQKQQERAVLTMLIYGSVLIHRVGRANGRAILAGFSIELIPGCRISTPFDKQGDPKISYGIEYSDDRRTRIVAFHVRRVSKTIGNSFTPVPLWDRVPAEDASYLSITEAAGLDRELPISVRVVRMARNRGEFIESSVECARAQTKYHGVTECAPGADPFDAAADDTDYSNMAGVGFTDVGAGVAMLYTQAGEKVSWRNAELPGPQFGEFSDVADERMARGLNCSKSAFTRSVSSSYSAGRMEQQQDTPIIDQLRQSFMDAWHRVDEWFIEAVWLENVVDLPGYRASTRAFWTQHRATFPGRVHINPVDEMKARETAMMLRTTTPQEACEEDGGAFDTNLDQWADAILMSRAKEKEKGLPEGSLAILFSSKAMTTETGVEVAPGQPKTPEDPAAGDNQPAPVKKNGKKLNGFHHSRVN